jgi:2-polyprenyl-3-methyl-5-hydroxy-6-metoxy-1,4-benzoquinol methylase
VQEYLDLFRRDAVEGSFDMNTAVAVIEHIENLGLFLAELSRLLKPGGLALFTTSKSQRSCHSASPS